MGYIVYHISHNSNRVSILEKGLELRGRIGYPIGYGFSGSTLDYEPSIFVSNSKNILFFDWIDPCRENIDVWKIEDTQPLFEDIIMSRNGKKGHSFLKEAVPASKLKLIKSYKLYDDRKCVHIIEYPQSKIKNFLRKTYEWLFNFKRIRALSFLRLHSLR